MPSLENIFQGDPVSPHPKMPTAGVNALGLLHSIEGDDHTDDFDDNHDNGDELHVASEVIKMGADEIDLREEKANMRAGTSLVSSSDEKKFAPLKRSHSCFLIGNEPVEDTTPNLKEPCPKRARHSDRTSDITARRPSRISVNIPSRTDPITGSPIQIDRGCAPKKRGPGRPPTKKRSPGRPPTKKQSPDRPPTKRGPGRPPKAKKTKLNTKQQEWEVEKIVDSQIDALTYEHFYRVKWKGFTDNENTWEPKKNLVHCNKLLQDFEKGLKKKH